MATDSCPICLTDYTPTTRKRVVCQYCPAAACRGCQQQALLNTYEDPHCFSCKRGWSNEFMAANFPLTFRTNTLRKHRRKILFEREKAMLPAMQIFVEAKQKLETLQALRDSQYDTYRANRDKLSELRLKANDLGIRYEQTKFERERLKRDYPDTFREREDYLQLRKSCKKQRLLYRAAQDEERLHKRDVVDPSYATYQQTMLQTTRWLRIWDTGDTTGADAGAAAARREFVMRCPADDCRGFLSTAYRCGVCSKYTCSDCLEVLGACDGGIEALKAGHTCKPDLVETAKAIKKETRPCPKCGARIYKIDGCDQMYCTVDGCQTAFSWQTGHVVTGRIHNPHYYEWLRRQGGGAAPREVGDIPCGGLPAAWEFTRAILHSGALTTAEKNQLLTVHGSLAEFIERLNSYPARPPALANKVLNVQYLTNKLSEAEWQRQLELEEAKFARKREIGQILQTLCTAGSDLMREFQQRMLAVQTVGGRTPPQMQALVTDAMQWVRDEGLPNLEGLRTYTNEAFRQLGEQQRMAVPQINDKWEWVGIRILYRAKKTQATGGAAADAASDGPPPLGEPEAELELVV